MPPVAGPRLTSRAWDGTGGLRRAQEEVGASGPSRGQVCSAGVVGPYEPGRPGGSWPGPLELASPHVAGPTWKGRRRKEGEGGWSHRTGFGTPAPPHSLQGGMGLGWGVPALPGPLGCPQRQCALSRCR